MTQSFSIRNFSLTPRKDESLDALYGGKIKLIQSKRGYRFNVDSVILANEALGERGVWLDLGCGVGVIGIAMASLGQASKIYGLEIQRHLADRAARNALLNGVEKKFIVVEGDLKNPPSVIKDVNFSGIVCNPPYFDPKASITNSDSEKALARHEIAATLKDIVRFASQRLTSRKRLLIIYPAMRLTTLMDSLRAHKFEPRTLRFIHGAEGEKAKHIIVSAQKDGQPALEIRPPLIVHSKSGEYTSEMKDILRAPKT